MRNIYALFLLFIAVGLQAQSINVHVNENSQYLYERQLILNGKSGDDFLNIRSYDRKRLSKNVYDINKSNPNEELDFLLDENDMFLYQIVDENKDTAGFVPFGAQSNGLLRESENTFLRHFYRTPAQFFQLDSHKDNDRYQLRINPILHLAAGMEVDGLAPFVNQRGFQLDLSVGEKIYVSSNFLETQARFPSYITHYVEKYKAIPGNSFYKRYNSTIFNSEKSYDYMNSTAKLGFQIIPEIALEFGYGNNHIGHGIRSLNLSRFADNYLFLGIDTRVGRFIYQNIFSEIRGPREERDPNTGLRPKKYFASHYLGFKVLKNIQLGIFETVVFGRDAGFELHYLNPVILYRTVEGVLGSPDNMIMGVDARWDIAKRYSLYSQFVLDEFKGAELIFNNDDWWANKYAIQVGAKAFDFLYIKGLDINAEFNYIRPFMYSHKDYKTSWAHHHQSLAHPRGANLKEYLIHVRYSPSIRWDFSVSGMLFYQGLSPKGENLGEDPRESYLTRSHDHGNTMLQGDRDDISLIHGRVSYMLWHGAYIDVIGQMRTSTIEDKSNYFSIGFRWNASSLPFLQ